MKEICENIIDIVNNSIRAGAKAIKIEIHENQKTDNLTLAITDNGSGMDRVTLNRIADPFYSTKEGKKTGMGTSLLKYHAELTGGHFFITSESGKGTKVIAEFGLSHMDRQPLGDITGTLLLFLTGNPDIQFKYKHKAKGGTFTLDSVELSEVLEMKLNTPAVRPIIKEYIENNLKEIEAGE